MTPRLAHPRLKRRRSALHLAARLLAAALGLSLHGAGHAYLSEDGALRVSGFGTAGLSHVGSQEAGIGMIGAGGEPTDARPGHWSPHLDSKLAVQARYEYDTDWSFTGQVLSTRTLQGHYRPQVDWAFARWDASSQTSVRLGRIGAPLFMVSDTRDVGYANTAVRPPLDVYIQVPVGRFDGIDITHRVSVGDAAVALSLWGGSFSLNTQQASDLPGVTLSVKLGQVVGGNVTAALDNGLSFRAGVSQGRLDTRLAGLGGLPAPVYDNLQRTFFAEADPVSFSGLGVAYDRGPWIAAAEYTWLRSATPIPDSNGWYAMAGYRLGRFIPYAGVSALRVTDMNRRNPYAALLGAAGDAGELAQLFQVGLDASVTNERTQTLGLRWDAAERVALKLQWDRVSKPARSYGIFSTGALGSEQDRRFFEGRRRIDVVSVSVDFVF